MPSERIQRQIDQHLDAAEEASLRLDWDVARGHAAAALALDPGNEDAKVLLSAAEQSIAQLARSAEPLPWQDHQAPASQTISAATPTPSPAGQAPSAGGSTPSHAGPTLDSPAPQTTPSSFANGRYTVKRFLGEGGKKRVYLAHDTTLARDVAFALIKTDGLDVEGRERITREAQAMGRLGTHPHVVSVFDMGSEGESPYLVTELMQGGDIEGLLEQAPEHRLAMPDAVSLAVQVCRGLEFAHSHGLVHRDLKPGNVWLTADGTAKIGDFGLAVSLDRSRLTRAGMMVGTVSYMPPEQAMGGEVSPRSDLYSLGAMLYEMVTGRPPFVGEESVAIITQHLNVPPVSPTWHRPDCPPGLEALILRLLEKDATKRPASVAEVRQALEAVERRTAPVSGEATQDPSPGAGAAPHENPLYRRTFVGREQELRQLQATFDGAVSGNGALVMVAGEPGIGKTALCEQLATYVTVRGGRALIGHCYEEGSLSVPYLPFVEALRSYVLAREPEALRSELGSGATDVARIVSEVRDRVQVSPAVGGDPEEQRWRLYQSLTAFLRSASAVQPLLIILEDLHDADRGTIDLLLHLSRNLQGARLLLAGTYRDVEVDRTHPLSSALAELRRTAHFSRIPLRGLTVDEVHRMMCHLREQDVPWSRAEAVHRQTEGNPLFVQEVLRYLVEEGLVVRQDGRYVRAGGGDPDAGIPEGLRDVIGKRLARLSEQANQVLSVASVIGRDFRFDVLQAVSGRPEPVLEAALEEASERALIEARPALGTLGFRFTHAFFRQTLYDELFASRRLRLHQQVARALELTYGRRVEEHAAELAEHFAQSTDSADLEKALHYSEVAAQRAMAVYAYGEAARHLEQALKVQDVLDPDAVTKRCDLLLALGRALMPAGEPLRVIREVAEEAFLLAERLGDAGQACAACQMALLSIRRLAGACVAEVPEYQRWAERGDRYARPDSTDRANTDNIMALAAWAAGRFGEARQLRIRGCEVTSRLDDPDARMVAAYALLAQGTPPHYLPDLRRLVQVFDPRSQEGVNGRTLALGLLYGGFAHLAFGDRNRAEQLWAELPEAVERMRDANVQFVPMAAGIALATLDGDLERAALMGAQLSARAGEMSSPVVSRQWAAGITCRVLLHLGRPGEALAAWSHISDAEGLKPGRPLPDARAFAVLAAAHQGSLDLARAGMERLLTEWVDGAEPDETPVQMLAILLETAVDVGDQAAASRLALLLEPASSLIGTSGAAPGDLTAIARHLGAAANLRGEADEARKRYNEALALCLRVRFRPETALCRLQLAELLLARYPGERAEALDHLDFAITEFREMKMQPALTRALGRKDLLHA